MVCVSLLAIGFGVPASLAVSEDCRKAAFESVWAQKVRVMQAWDRDPKNRAYVERHKLKTADLSPATAALREQMLKGLDLACGVESIAQPSAGVIGDADQLARLVAAGDSLTVAVPREQDVVPSELRGVIAKDDLPVYDSPERVFDGKTQAAGGWFGVWGGYWPRMPVTVPVAVAPEPAGGVLMATGMFVLMYWLRRRA